MTARITYQLNRASAVPLHEQLTRLLRPAGESNTVEVWASTGKANGSRWYSGGMVKVTISADGLLTDSIHGIVMTMVTVAGLVHNAHWNDIQNEIQLDDLFRD